MLNRNAVKSWHLDGAPKRFEWTTPGAEVLEVVALAFPRIDASERSDGAVLKHFFGVMKKSPQKSPFLRNTIGLPSLRLMDSILKSTEKFDQRIHSWNFPRANAGSPSRPSQILQIAEHIAMPRSTKSTVGGPPRYTSCFSRGPNNSNDFGVKYNPRTPVNTHL